MNGAQGGPGSRGSRPLPSRSARLAGPAAAVVGAALLFAGLLRGIPKVYDLPDHLGYTFQVLQAFARGDFYPRWLASLNDGFGEATYVFYPPVLHFTSAALAALLGGDVLAGLYVALFLFAVAGGLGIFRFVSRVCGPEAGAIACLLFALVPFRVFEMYSSGLYSAFAAAGIAPWALLALARIAETDESSPPWEKLRRVALWALSFAAIVLTNMPSAVLWTYLIGIWVIADVLVTRRWRLAARVIAGGAWGSLIAGIYLLPAVVEMRWVDVPLETAYRSNFLFQGSGSGMKPGLKSMFDRMELFPLLALALSLAVFAVARQWGELRDSRSSVFVHLTAVLGLASAFLASTASVWAWRWLPELKRVNFPWRFLEPMGLATASAAAAALVLLWRASGRSVLVRILALFFLVSLSAVCLVFDIAISDAEGRVAPAVARAAIPSFSRKEVFFLLKGARRAADMAGEPPAVCEGSCRVQILDWSPTRRELLVSSPQPTRVVLRTYYFPGWRGELRSSEPLPLRVGPEPGTGRIEIAVPAGDNRVVVRFTTTPPRVIGGIVSAAALAAGLAVLWRARRSRLYQI